MANIRAECEVPTSPERVWAAIAGADALVAWFCEHAEVDLAAGTYRFWGIHTMTTPTGDAPAGELEHVDEGRKLSFAWMVRGARTKVTYSIESTGAESATVVVRHESVPSRPSNEDAAFHDFWYVALENLRLYLATGRAQSKPDYASQTADTVKVSVPVAGSREHVYRCISDPEELNRYFGRDAEVDLRKGGEISFGWEEGGPVRILDLDPPRLLSYSWQYPEEPSTVVTWTVEESAGATVLTITHSGFGDNFRTDAYAVGWFSFLVIIKGMVELGDAWKPVRIEGVEHGAV